MDDSLNLKGMSYFYIDDVLKNISIFRSGNYQFKLNFNNIRVEID